MKVQNRRLVSATDAPLHAIPEGWRVSVADEGRKVNVINAEICVLTRLRGGLRGSHRALATSLVTPGRASTKTATLRCAMLTRNLFFVSWNSNLSMQNFWAGQQWAERGS